ncbi:hypothetical protein, partial [Blautia sp. MSJ-19]|uniref:hypothetical protein n=1 Tax=Blautia sp. MSJ-19 TaxID=2841517 RepID=UPI001C0EE24C
AICESSLVILFVVNLLYLKGEHLALFIFNIQFTPLYGHNLFFVDIDIGRKERLYFRCEEKTFMLVGEQA